MSKAIKSVQAAVQAIRDLTFNGVSISTQGADSELCIAIDYAEADIEDPGQLEPIYQAIDAALSAHGCARGEATLVDGIEGIKITLPAGLEPVQCDGMTAHYEPGFVEVANRGKGVAMKAWGVITGSDDADWLGARCQIVWEENGNGDALDWDAPEEIRIV